MLLKRVSPNILHISNGAMAICNLHGIYTSPPRFVTNMVTWHLNDDLGENHG